MIKKMALALCFFVAPCTHAISLTDNAVVKTAQNFLEQPGATWADTAVFIACASVPQLWIHASINAKITDKNEKTNDLISAFGFPLTVTTPWVIRGAPVYKWLTPFIPFVGICLIYQKRALPNITYMCNNALAGYAGLLAKNIITRYVTK